jgi:arylsulfatase A-like enzyme
MAAARPNVLLVVFDTARADAFEPYGAAPASTPAIADLARRGAAAPVAIAPCNWTLPSHASMFTGLLPGALGLASASAPRAAAGMASTPAFEARRDRVLAEVLRARGYATGAVSSNPWISRVNGFATGFERFTVVPGRSPRPRGTSVTDRVGRTVDALRATSDDGAAEVERLLRTWLTEDRDKPFFWFVNLMECHSPYLPPRPFNDLGPIARVRAAREADRYLTVDAMHRYCERKLEIPAEAIERMRHLYARAVTMMDRLVGRLVEALDRAGLLDETLVIVTSDHGENLGENHLISHVLSLDDRLLRVPLISAGPLPLAGDGLVSLVALPSLIAGAIGLDDHPWTDDALAEGAAVAQASTEMLVPVTEIGPALGISEDTIQTFARTMTCATDGRLKVVRDAAGDRIYDLAADPLEATPVAEETLGDRSASVAPLRLAIDRALEASSERPQALDAAPLDPAEAAALEERMRQLGYM